MKNYLMEGDTITLTAPYAVVSGDGLLVGSIFGVACGDAAISADVEAITRGAFTIKKATAQVWTQGTLIYWDNVAKNCTTTLTSNKLIGVAITAALSADIVGNVRLNSAFIS